MVETLTSEKGLQPHNWSSLCLSIAEQAPLPMATVEGGAHIVRYVNPAFCRLLEKIREQLIGKPFGEIVPETNQCLTLLDRVYRTGKPESHTEQAAVKSQPLFWSYTLWPVMVDKHPVAVMIQVTETALLHQTSVAMNEALLLGSLRQHELTEAADRSNLELQEEISERKRAEAELQRLQAQLMDRAGQLEGLVAMRTAELTATNNQLEAFIHTLAHDLRAPLRAMQGFSEMLVMEAGAALNETSKAHADRIDQAAKFMDAMLIDLLAFSHISQQHIELTSINLDTVAESVLARLQKDILQSNADVKRSGPWPAVLAHEPTLARVLFNLTSNALKFVKKDVPSVVRLWTEEKAGFIRVWVADNGLGIAADHHSQIFRLFTRLDGEKYAGTGTGLAIVQNAISRMGGRLGVESIPGEGSRFWFELRKSP